MLLFTVILSAICLCSSYKIVVLGPSMSNSQIIFNARIAEALADAGNDVTLALIDIFDDVEINVKFQDNIKIYRVNASIGINPKEIEEAQSKRMFKDVGMLDPAQRKFMQMFTKMFIDGCRVLARNEKFMSWLENEKFDVAFAYMYHICPVGLIHKAKIPAWVWLNSGGLMDYVAWLVGVPLIPSYVPPMAMESHDEMTFYERAKSVIGHHLMRIIWPRILARPETQILREEFGADFPDLEELAASCPLVMVNSNEMYDLPRPTLAKVINIGGVGYQMKAPKPLAPEFQSIVDKAKGIVIFTFGSHAPAHKMPLEWKNALLGAFKRFPEYQFILRYKERDLDDRLPSNVHLFNWIPQSDLLQNDKTKAFISHGGYNSLQETIAAGVPLITIALFGDQHKNSKIAEKHGFAIALQKSEITEETIYNSLEQVLNNQKYSKTVKRLSAMVKKQPFGSEEKLVKWTEFLAEFKTLENLQPAGTKLNYIQYHSIDVYALFFVVISVVLVILFKIVRCTGRRICRLFGKGETAKPKND